MKPVFHFLFLFFLFSSCSQQNLKDRIKQDSLTKANFFAQIEKRKNDSIRAADSVFRYSIMNRISLKDSLFGVFNFGKNWQGILVDHFSSRELDSIAWRFASDDSIQPWQTSNFVPAFDSIPRLHYIRSERLNKWAKTVLPQQWIIYDDSKSSLAQLTGACFVEMPCMEYSLVLLFQYKESDSLRYPLLASVAEKKIRFGKFPAQEKIIAGNYQRPGAAIDSTPMKVFANDGKKYFVYTDDFRWNTDLNAGIYPGRQILYIAHDSVIELRRYPLDLHGDACD